MTLEEEKEKDYYRTLSNISACKSIKEIDILIEYVKKHFLGYKLNGFFWQCERRFDKQKAIISKTLRLDYDKRLIMAAGMKSYIMEGDKIIYEYD